MKIDIGGWKHHEKHPNASNWTIVDVNPACPIKCFMGVDALPFPDNSIEAIYSSHTLEHILPHTQEYAFNEMFRVLKPGGQIRIIVPDFDIAVKRYVAGDSKWMEQSICKVPSLPDHINLSYLSGFLFTYPQHDVQEGKSLGLGGHVMPFNLEMLTHYLEKSGFSQLEQMSHNICSPVFNGMDLEMHKDISLYVEATK